MFISSMPNTHLSEITDGLNTNQPMWRMVLCWKRDWSIQTELCSQWWCRFSLGIWVTALKCPWAGGRVSQRIHRVWQSWVTATALPALHSLTRVLYVPLNTLHFHLTSVKIKPRVLFSSLPGFVLHPWAAAPRWADAPEPGWIRAHAGECV